MKKLVSFPVLWLLLCLLTCGTGAFAQTPVAQNGQLQVIGLKLCNQYGNPIQLRGMSTHGIQWYGWGDCLTEASLDALAYDWGADVLRISLYVQEGGYETDPAGFTAQVNRLIEEATERGMYALVDWHQLTPGDPNYNLARAKTFFTAIANQHKNKNNIIYDVCNEPNGVTWARIKTYADQIIPVIRAIDSDAVVLVGTHAWASMGISDGRSAQDIVSNPLSFSNIMYTFHFYAKSHGTEYLNELSWAADRLPVFVTEFGSQEASGDGANDFTRTQQYIDLMRQKKISWCNWNYSDDSRSGAVWLAGTCGSGPWTTARLKPAGAWIRERMLVPADDFPGGGNQLPTVSITSPAAGATFTAPATVNITATAADTDGTISKVEFFEGANKIGEDLVTPYEFSWTGVAAGSYSLTAKATDNAGGTKTSTAVNITVTGTPGCTPVSASGDDGNVAANVLDNNLATRWSASGDGQWIQFCLGATAQNVNGVKIAFYKGNERRSIFDIQLSQDGTSWTNAATGLQSSGTSLNLETFSFTAASARYVRILGHGNTVNAWNSYTEVQVQIAPPPSCQPVTASGDDGNVPANVLDNDLNTRWSASGDGQWIQFCLGTTAVTVNNVQIAFFKGNERRSNFDIQLSQDGTSWTNAATGLQSSGTSLNLETFAITPASAKYVRILGHGNTVNAWNSYTEVEINTSSGAGFMAMAKTEDAGGEDALGLTAAPNPFSSQTNVSFTVQKAGQTRLAVFDMNGKMIAVLVNSHLTAGKHTVPFRCGEIPAGNYILKLEQQGKASSKKIQKY